MSIGHGIALLGLAIVAAAAIFTQEGKELNSILASCFTLAVVSFLFVDGDRK